MSGALEDLELRRRLLLMAAHDLRAPLNTIKVATGVLTDAPPAVVQCLQSAVQRMDDLIHDLLDHARIDGGKLLLNCERHDLLLLCQEAVEGLRPLAQAKGLELEFTWQASGPQLFGTCDRGRFLQALSNIIDNAIKFTPARGVVRVELHETCEAVEILVRDTGPGMGPDTAARAFECFWQSPLTAQEGSGLGLFIAKSIVEAHGGQIRVASEVDRGSEFQLHFPKDFLIDEPASMTLRP